MEVAAAIGTLHSVGRQPSRGAAALVAPSGERGEAFSRKLSDPSVSGAIAACLERETAADSARRYTCSGTLGETFADEAARHQAAAVASNGDLCDLSPTAVLALRDMPQAVISPENALAIIIEAKQMKVDRWFSR